MCIAIYKPAKTAADWDAYARGYISNPDSWGFAAVRDGRLHSRWGVDSFEEFVQAYEPFSECQSIIHFRIRTSGLVDVNNCHPFYVSGSLAFVHNGMIDIDHNINPDRSDTWHFNERVLKPLYRSDADFFRREDVIRMQQRAHGGNKFAFLRADGAYAIWNAGAGIIERDGHWYSNSGYQKSRWMAVQSRPASVSVTVDISRNDHRTLALVDDTVDFEEIDDRQDYDDYATQCDLEREARSEWYYDADADDHEQHMSHYTAQMCDDLRASGISDETVREVYALLDREGIEALHNAL